MQIAELTLFITFVAGLLSFSSPCVIPLVPGFLAYLAGTSIGELPFKRKEVLINASFFVLGLSLVFTTLGVILNSVLSAASFPVQQWLARLGGAVVIAFGLDLAGLIHLPMFGRVYGGFPANFSIKHHFVRSFALGSAFAAGWTPCVGPVLGAVLGLAMLEPGSAFSLLIAYSFGLGLPFLVVGPFAANALHLMRGHAKSLSYVRVLFGVLLIIVGVLTFTQTLNLLGTPAAFNILG